jgi:Winged helix DNA-binding domain
VQAQDREAARLAIRARCDGPPAELGRDLVRTWAMRGTLHVLAAEDLPLALAVFGPLQLARGQRRLTQLGLPPAEAERSTAETAAVLAEHGPLTRHELAARLRERGVPVAAEGQAPIHVVHRAAAAGVLIETGVRGRDELYGPLDVRLPDRDGALGELARRYARSHAPATAADFASWSGLPAADVRAAWQDPTVEGDAEEGGVRLLPAFDEWLLGWSSRDLVLAPAHAKRVAPGGGIIRPVAVADGRVFATWRLDRRRGRVELDPFGRVTKAMRAGVEAEVEAILGHALLSRPCGSA